MFAKVSFAKLSTSLSSVLELVKTQTVTLSFVHFEGGDQGYVPLQKKKNMETKQQDVQTNFFLLRGV